MKTFLRTPELGGLLAIVNGLSWLALIAVVRCPGMHIYDRAVVLIGMILSLPIAWPFLLPRLDYQPTVADTVFACTIIGVNTFAWGYGLAWLWRTVFRRYSLRLLFAAVTIIAVMLGILRWMT